MKNLNILGISAFYHDSAACLVQDGKIVAAAQEDRFSRIKHDHNFPEQAIKYCLKEGKITISDLDYVVFYDKPFLKFERMLETYLSYAPLGIRSFLMAIPLWIRKKLWIPDLIEKSLGYKGKILFMEHHESHAASAFFLSPFKRAAFLTMDGVGEWATASFGVGNDHSITIDSELLPIPLDFCTLPSPITPVSGSTLENIKSWDLRLMGNRNMYKRFLTT